MKTQIASFVLLGSLVAGTVSAECQNRGGGHVRSERLKCESSNGSFNECNALGMISSVKVIDQLSRSDCKEGSSYGIDGDRLWVDEGCRAEFELYYGSVDSDVVRCGEIKSNRYQSCETGSAISFVEVDRQLSGERCAYGRNYGYEGSRIWTDSGCQADFLVTFETGGDDNDGGAFCVEEVRCESRRDRSERCSLENSDAVVTEIKVSKQLSSSDCREGESYGANLGEIWVTEGCRAEFTVESTRADDEVVCESWFWMDNECEVETADGREIKEIALKEDYSGFLGPCKKGETYGVDRDTVWVSGGCRAKFSLVY